MKRKRKKSSNKDELSLSIFESVADLASVQNVIPTLKKILKLNRKADKKTIQKMEGIINKLNKKRGKK